MYTLRKARTSATDFVTCPEFCHVSWLQQEQLPSSRSIFFHQNQKLSPDASYPPCATAVFSHCFALSFRGFRKACGRADVLRSHWRWILPISYVVFGGLPRRFGVEASWRHGTAFRSAERHMFDLQILNSMRSIGGNN